MTPYRHKKPPPKAHPLIQHLWREAITQRASFVDVAKRAGLAIDTIYDWRVRRQPYLPNVIAVGDVLGLELVWRRKRDTDDGETDNGG